MAIKHSELKIIKSKTGANIIEVHIPTKDFDSLVKQATKNKRIQPEFLIQILCRHLIAKRGAHTNAGGSVDNW